MKNLILLSTTLLLAILVNAQIVNIPDGIFKAYLVSDTLINTNQDTEIQVSEANTFTGGINVNGMNISDLTGIETFTAITTLECYYNNLTSLDVSNNSALFWFVCSKNNLTSLDVSNNTALFYLNCDLNGISSLDVSNNTALSYLDCAVNQLSSLDVSNNTALTLLYCDRNDLTSLNVKNGNNTAINYLNFQADYNPNLYCIQVDDTTWSTFNWTDIDPQSYFSEDCTTSEPNELQTPELKIAPNPFKESLTISLPDNVDEVEIALYNVLGKQIEVSSEIVNDKIRINGTNLKQGIYFVELRENNKLIGKAKLIKE